MLGGNKSKLQEKDQDDIINDDDNDKTPLTPNNNLSTSSIHKSVVKKSRLKPLRKKLRS